MKRLKAMWLLTCAVAVLCTCVAQAKNYETVFSQDFEGEKPMAELYEATFTSTVLGTTASTETNAVESVTAYNPEILTRTIYNSTDTSQFFKAYRKQKKTSMSVSFLMPSDTKTLTDYRVEFDVYFSPTVGSGGVGGLAIIGTKGILATFYVPPGAKDKASDSNKLYLGDSTETQIATFTTWARGASPADASSAQYWTHVTLTGNSKGVFMTAVQANGTVLCTDYPLSTTLDNIDVLYQYEYTKAGIYDAYLDIDNVVVGKAIEARTYTWTGAEDKLWANAANWTVDGKVTEFYPTSSDPAVIDIPNQTIVVLPGQEFGEFTADETTVLAVMASETGDTFTPPEGFATDHVIASGPFALGYDATEGVFTATRVPSAFTWANAEGGNWQQTGNWLVEGLPTAALPNATDSTFFNDTVTVTTTATALTSNLVVNAVLTIADTGDQVVSIGDATTTSDQTVPVTGAGSLVLRNVHIRSGFRKVDINVPIEFAADSVNVFWVTATKSNGGFGFNLNKAVTGSGKIEVTQTVGGNNANIGVDFVGDMSAFTGSVEFYLGRSSSSGKITYQQRALDHIYPSFNGANSSWNIYADHWGDVDVARERGNYFAEGNATYAFGALKLRVPSVKYDLGYVDNVTIEVGTLDEDSYSVGSWRSAKGYGIHWIAPTATFANNSANTSFIKVSGGGVLELPTSAGVPTASLSFTEKGGTLKVGYDLVVDPDDPSVTNAVPVDPSSVITNSTATLVFDDQGTNGTWATKLDADNLSGFTKRGAGTLLMARGTYFNGALRIEDGGKIGLVDGFTGDTGVLLSWNKDASAREITLDDFAGKAEDPVKVSIVTNDTKIALRLSREAKSYVYVGPDLGDWSDPNNWQIGGVTALVAPSSDDDVLIEGRRVLVEPGLTVGEVTLESGAKLVVSLTTSGQIFTQRTDVLVPLTTDDVLALGPFTFTLKEGVFTSVHSSSTFVWVAEGNGAWHNVDNWTVNDLPTRVVPGYDKTYVDSTDFSRVSNPVTVTLTEDAYGDTVYVGDADLTFTANKNLCVYCITNKIDTAGHVILRQGVVLKSNNVDPSRYFTMLEIPEGEVAYVRADNEDPRGRPQVHGKVIGSGTFNVGVTGSRHAYTGVQIYGDMSEFAGTVDVVASGSSNVRNQTQLFDGDGDGIVGSSHAVWNVNNAANGVFVPDAAVTAYFGALNGSVYQGSVQAGLFVIGALNEDCGFNGTLNQTPIRKIGTGRFTCGAQNIGDVDIVEGIYEPTANTQSGNLTFSGGQFVVSTEIDTDVDYANRIKNSSASIDVDVSTIDRTWASEIDASNTGGLVKRGDATLTLSTAPKYGGLTTVLAGRLVVPAGTAIALDALSVRTVDGATITSYSYRDGATIDSLTPASESPTVTYWPGVVDLSNLTIDASRTALAERAVYPIVSANAFSNLKAVKRNLILPEGARGWSLAVKIYNGHQTLVLTSLRGLKFGIRKK